MDYNALARPAPTQIGYYDHLANIASMQAPPYSPGMKPKETVKGKPADYVRRNSDSYDSALSMTR